MGILKGWNSPKRLSTELCEYILNNYDNSDYVTIFGRVDMTSLYLTQREMMETSQFCYHIEISPRTIIEISMNHLL